MVDCQFRSHLAPAILIAATVRNQLEPRDRKLMPVFEQRIAGVLMAPPCTHFAGSGARWWAGKDARGETAEAVQIVQDCLAVVYRTQPDSISADLLNGIDQVERVLRSVIVQQRVPTGLAAQSLAKLDLRR